MSVSLKNEIRVGVVVILGVILIVLGTLWMQGWRIGREEQQVEAWFREVGQIQRGNPVKVRGVRIGRVEEIALDPTGEGVLVRFTMHSDVQLPDDPIVLLAPESMFGDWQAEIYARSQFPLYDYAIPREAGVLPGYALPDMSRLTAVADRIAENMAGITERFDIAFTDETAMNLRMAIDNIEQVTSQLTGMLETQARTIDELGTGLETVTATVQEVAESARRAFLEVEQAVAGGQLANIVRNVDRMTTTVDTLTQSLVVITRDMSGAVASAETAFVSLNALMASLERGEGTLGQLFQDTALYADLVATNLLVQHLIQDFQRNPRRYINLRIF
jgi:phospholipid/cholesterol/gamma-HCH transport system substrate-binding protein